MNFKSISINTCFLTLALTSYYVVADEDFSFDSFDISLSTNEATTTSKGMDVDDLDMMVTGISSSDLTQIRSCPSGEAFIWLTILNQLNIAKIVDEPFYKKTSVPLSRNLINYPTFQLATYQPQNGGQFTTHLFYNQTSKKQFRASEDDIDGTRIGSYLNIENKTILMVLDEAFENPLFPPLIRNTAKNIDTALLVRTFGSARLEERRLGLMGHFIQEFDNKSYFEAKLPILWVQRNLNFTQGEKDIIQKQLSIFEGGDFDEDTFAKQHLVFDSFGAGTLELSICKKVWEGGNWSVDIGGGVLLPTDYAVRRGLYGTYIEPKDQHPVLAFCDLASLAPAGLKPNAKKTLENYFLGALDHLTSLLLHCPLGYDKHLGFELKLLPFWEIRPDLQFNGQYTLEVLIPQEQQRFFVPVNSTVFSEYFANLPETTEAEQQAKLAALQERITTLLYPRVINTKIFPGIVFTSVSSLQRTYRDWNFSAGYSGWYQSKEKIVAMEKFKNSDLNLSKSLNTSSYSVKLFGKIHRIIHSKRHDDFSLSIWADGTVFNRGVGNDFSFGISLDSKF